MTYGSYESYSGESSTMQRPTAVTVFGILNIAFGAMALVCTPLSFLMSFASQAMLENMPDVPQAENPFQEMMEAPGFMTYTYVTTALAGGGGLFSFYRTAQMRPWRAMSPSGMRLRMR